MSNGRRKNHRKVEKILILIAMRQYLSCDEKSDKICLKIMFTGRFSRNKYDKQHGRYLLISLLVYRKDLVKGSQVLHALNESMSSF